MITTFRVTQTFDVPSADCHSVEAYAMSHFGTPELPDHIKVEIVSQEDPSAPADQVNATNAGQKAEDDQPATDGAA